MCTSSILKCNCGLVTSAVPQGLILWTILSNIFINNLEKGKYPQQTSRWQQMGEYSICSRVQHSFRGILKGWRKGLTETLWNITNTNIASWVWDRIPLCSSPYWCQNIENSFAEKDLPEKLNTSQQCAGVQKRSPADWAVLVREQTSLQRIQGIFSCIRPFWEHAGVLFLVLGSPV